MKKLKTMVSLAAALGIMATAIPMTAGAVYSINGEICQTDSGAQVTVSSVDMSEPKQVFEIYFKNVDASVTDKKAAYEEIAVKILSELGIESTDVVCSKYMPMFVYELTEEQVIKIKQCELVTDLKMATPSSSDNIGNPVVTPCGPVVQPGGSGMIDTVPTPDDVQPKQAFEIYFKDVDTSVTDKKTAYEEIAVKILSELGIESTDVECSKYTPMFVYELTEEQVTKAKQCELVTDLKMAASSSADNIGNPVVTPDDSYPAGAGTSDNTPIVNGDVNNDGVMNIRDAALISKKLAEGKGDELPECADYNKDSKKNIRDAAAMAKDLAASH